MSEVFEKKVLDGKTAVITGGGSGINLSIAKRFAEHGAKVALIGRTREKLDTAASEIRDAGGVASGHPADVRDFDALTGAIKSARETHGEIDLVVCGAAGNFPAPALGMSANAFKSVVDIDLLGTFNTCRAVFEHLRRPGASIINISATQAFIPMPMLAHVCAAQDEIADLALFLSRGAARFITGAVVVCDGGQSLSGFGANMMAALRPRA